MSLRLKPLHEQVIVITGATSGIGLVTARTASERGARLVLAARNEQALADLAAELSASGREAIAVAADVGSEEDIRRVADAAISRFGGFDTWVNNAGVSVYGNLLDIPIADQRQMFETNFWGVVYGSRIAARHLCTRGGALVNLGSGVYDRAVPVQGIYSASKHAVKGYTDALRMELEKEKLPISVNLFATTAIDTPFPRHAANYMEVEPTLPPPVYAPELVAGAILHAAEHPVRDLYIGEAAKMISSMGKYAPRLTDKYMEATMFDQQRTERPAVPGRRNSLYAAGFGLEERGDYEGHVFESSPLTKASMHPLLAGALAFGTTLAVAGLLRARSPHTVRGA
jgi:short-subunit dehydrogenase